MKNRAFLIGAGFSKPAGFPLVHELFAFIEEYLKRSKDQIDIEFYPEYLRILTLIKGRYPALQADMELFITLLDLAIMKNDLKLFCGIIDDLLIFRQKLSGAIADAFWWKSLSFVNNSNKNSNLYDEFCSLLGKGDAVVTFNYDLLVENCLWKQNKWSFLDGYGFNKKKSDFEDADLGKIYPLDKAESSLIKIYKLHGSVGWAYDEVSEKIFFDEMPNYLSGYRGLFCEKNGEYLRAKHDKASAFIEPSYIKNYNNSVSRFAWDNAFKTILECDELFVIGYSLSEIDSSAKLWLSTAIENSKITKIIVVDPSKVVQYKYRNCFGNKVVAVQMGFEQWIENQK